MAWTVDLRSLDGATLHNGSTPFGSGRITWALDGVGAADFNLRATDVSDGRWAYGRRRIVVKDGGGTTRYQGWLDRLERGGPPGAEAYRAASRGLAAALDEAVVHGNVAKVTTADTTIAWDLIQHAQAQTDNHWGFTLGTVTGTPTSRTRYYCDGDAIGESIRELAEMSAGFGWDIDASGAFNAWVGGRGSDLTATYTLAPTDSIDWQCVADTVALRTYMTGMGDADSSRPCGPPLVTDSDATAIAAGYGRREGVVDSETLDEFEMEEKTTEELRARIASRVNLRTSWIEGSGPWSFGTVWLGDTVTAALGTEFGGNLAVRLVSITVSLESKYEFIECEWEAA